ncbi:MAG TPA: alpha/beta hydrolase [Alphaproteobacteria bacterium]|nr:alpha/beta hydrolase [Alphaproteobacteria bacterium]
MVFDLWKGNFSMLAVSAILPEHTTNHPSIILVHGAANSGRVWTFWQRALAEQGWASYAIDLRGHGQSVAVDLSHIGMSDYAADVRTLAGQFKHPPVVMGWSMGGLVALMAAADGVAAACVALAPSTPARQRNAGVTLRTGEFGPEEYGITSDDPEQQPAMPDLDREERLIALASLSRESRLARDERQAGIVIASLPCPLLLITGTADRAWPRERYTDLWLAADYVSVEGASHWGLVLNRRALATMVPAVVQWLVQCG